MTCSFLMTSAKDLGGFERRFLNLAEYMYKQQKQDVRVVLTKNAMRSLDEIGFLHSGLDFVVLDKSSRHKFTARIYIIFGLLSYLLRFHFFKSDHIHVISNPGWLTTLLAVAGARFSSSIVDSRHDYRLLHLWILSIRVHNIDCLSQSIRDYVVKNVPLKRMKSICKVAPCSFYSRQKIIEGLEKDIDICFIGRNVTGKGGEFLPELRKSLPNYKIFADHTDNPYPIFARSKIFLSLQEIENYPSQALLEAMASGCCVIASDVGETKKIITQNTGVLVDRNIEDIIVAIRRLSENWEMRTTLADAGRALVMKHHTIEKFYSYFVSVIK